MPTASQTAPADTSATTGAPPMAWHEIVLATLKANEIRLVTYVPDNVLRPLMEALHADPYFTMFCTTREEEALGIVTGAWMGGMRGIVLMQTIARGKRDKKRVDSIRQQRRVRALCRLFLRSSCRC